MYNYNDARAFLRAYGNKGIAGITIAIIPGNLTSEKDMFDIFNRCMYGDDFNKPIDADCDKKLKFYYHKIKGDIDRVYRIIKYKNYSILTIESAEVEAINSLTWKQVVEEEINDMEYDRIHSLNIYESNMFPNHYNEYRFYCNAMILGTIDTIHMMAETQGEHGSIMLHAFLRAAIYKKHVSHSKEFITPGYQEVERMIDKLIRRWK